MASSMFRSNQTVPWMMFGPLPAGLDTTTESLAVASPSRLSLTVRSTWYIPTSLYVWATLTPVAVVPSPNSQE